MCYKEFIRYDFIVRNQKENHPVRVYITMHCVHLSITYKQFTPVSTMKTTFLLFSFLLGNLNGR